MSNKVFEILKWAVIIVMGITILTMWKSNRSLNASYEAYKKDGSYLIAYQSQTINELKSKNRELYDSIKKIENVKQAVIIEYKYVYNGDTVYIDREIPPIENDLYVFEKKSDTISYNLQIKGKEVEWYKLDFTLNDKLTLINREENGDNLLSITTSSGGGRIEGSQVFNKKSNKNSFINRFSYGIQVGVGYGLISKTPDVYVGVGVSFRLNKIK